MESSHGSPRDCGSDERRRYEAGFGGAGQGDDVVQRWYRHAGIGSQRRTQRSRPGLRNRAAGDAEACDKGTHAGGQGDRVQHGIRMPKTLLARAATAALTHDARLVPRETLEITSRELERHICDAVNGLLGGELDEHAMRRLVLPGALGGCGLRMDAVGLAADAAFWSTWAMTTSVAPGICQRSWTGKGVECRCAGGCGGSSTLGRSWS